MNRLFSCVILSLCLLFLCGCAGTPRLAGTWALVAVGERTLDVPAAPQPGHTLKALGRDRFVFGPLGEDGRLAGGGGGDWFFKDGRYHEVVHFHFHPVLVGETIAFDCAIEGDLWHHRADFVAKGERFHIDETWRRLSHRRSKEARRERH